MSPLTAERFTHLPQHPTADPVGQALAALIEILADLLLEDTRAAKRSRA